MSPFTKKQRVEHYSKAIEILTKLERKDLTNGICIVLGQIVYGNFNLAPWTYWRTLVEYFPELENISDPCDEISKFETSKEKSRFRIEILQTAKMN